jgi:integrase
VTVNHDLKLLRKMFNWGIRKGYLERTPFQVGSESAITLEREIPRDWRFESDGDEEGLFNAANPHLRAVLIALLDTAARLGEILSLQWKDVNLERRELVVRAEKSTTRTGRVVPISGRLLATLEMRRSDPAGQPFPSDAYVFGDALGRNVKSVRTAWKCV